VLNLVRIVDDQTAEDSWFDRFILWALGGTPTQTSRNDVAKVLRAGECRRFGSVVRRMIFCDGMQELRSGALVSIADRKSGLHAFLGDSDSLGVALFLGADGLYGYDGEKVSRVANATFDWAILHDLPTLKRTFLSSSDGFFELRRRGDAFELVKLTSPASKSLLTARFYVAPDNMAVLAFTQDGIYQVIDGALVPVWSIDMSGPIAEYGGTPPTLVRGWSGMLFSTGYENHQSFHLLKSCT